MIPVFFDDNIPDSGPELEVRRVPAAASMQILILGKRWRGYWTHWNSAKHRTQPCLTPKETCPGHRAQLPLRWKAYLHVHDVMQKDQCLLELTPGAARQLKAQLADRETLRGLRLTISRGKGPKARLQVSIQQVSSEREMQRWPQERDPLITLSKLWGFAPASPPDQAEDDLT